MSSGANHNDRTARIVDTLTEQVLAEPALLAFEHIGERLQRPLVGARNHRPPAAVVEQRIHRLLQHPLFVTDDDVGRPQLHKPLETVVAVDNAAVEVVEIGGRKPTAIQRHQRSQFRRITGTTVRIIHSGRLPDSMNASITFSRFAQFLGLQLGRRLGNFLTQVFTDLMQVHVDQGFHGSPPRRCQP